MTLLPRFPLLAIVCFSLWGCRPGPSLTTIYPGMIIDRSVTVRPGMYPMAGSLDLTQPVLIIRGNNITVDFNGAELVGAPAGTLPDQFQGLCIRVEEGSNVTIRNLSARGYRVALLAEGVDSLKVLDCDFSYNYRQRLFSGLEREDLSDWLSYHENEHDEWLRYGAAVYLKNCRRALVKGLRVTGGQNGLMLTGCEDGLFYNNTIQFNSGVGIGLYRSSRNRVMHNRLDWNVRGHSHGYYRRGQDSAGILCYEQSSRNLFAFNSATHCGDGFFLWAGQQTIDSGEGGCNENVIYGNDFSFASTNGIEVTFSHRNHLVNNTLEGCRYGIWGGYSYNTLMLGNRISGNEYGIAIEHGNGNAISGNLFRDNEVGVKLWQREEQPLDWAFSRRRNVASRDYQIGKNVFRHTRQPLHISASSGVDISENTFTGFDRLLSTDAPNKALSLRGNLMDLSFGWGNATPFLGENEVRQGLPAPGLPDIGSLYNLGQVQPLPDGMPTSLPAGIPKGLSHILIHEWGPYDFRYPSIWLRGVEDGNYLFVLLGPGGAWQVTGSEGFESLSATKGTFPATLTARCAPDSIRFRIDLAFTGETVTTVLGAKHESGANVPFRFSHIDYNPRWWVRFYEYDESTHPLKRENGFRQLADRKAGYEMETDSLAFVWWGSPGGGVDSERFATFAETGLDLPAGTYRLLLTSDDGVRLYLDNRRLIDRWDIHTPATDALELRLSGRHTLLIEHFEAGGLATLGFQLDLLR